jgi:hypothetical protein
MEELVTEIFAISSILSAEPSRMVWKHFSSLRVSNYQKTTRTGPGNRSDSDWISREE